MQQDRPPFFRTAEPSTPASVVDVNPPVSDLPSQYIASNNILTMTRTPNEAFNKKRLDRACDWCRKRKTRCDGSSKQNNICSNCTQNLIPCTYVEVSKPRGPPKAYITSLEDRMERMEALLKRLRPEQDFTQQLGPPVVRDSWKHDASYYASKQKKASTVPPPESAPRQRQASPQLNAHQSFHEEPRLIRDKSPADEDPPSSEDFASSDEEYAETSLMHGVKRLTFQGLVPVANVIDSSTDPGQASEERDTQMRFHGKSSLFYLIGPTREFRKQHIDALHGLSTSLAENPPLRRQMFWTSLPWERAWEGIYLHNPALFRPVIESFPPPDLAIKLIDLYFYNSNLMYPILHRQIFDIQWADGLHRRDVLFAAVCLSLFAVGSRWSDDSRVIGKPRFPSAEFDQVFSGYSSSHEQHWGLAGWSYITAVLELLRYRRSVLYPACLFEMQLYCLVSMYLRFQSPSSSSWCFSSIGIRKAQDVGIHRKKLYNKSPTAEDELWKRSFWLLIGSDRIAAAALGRSCSSRAEDIDVELLLEVDDQYWLTDTPFTQPSGEPSSITAFNLWIKLTQVAAFAVRTLYAVDKSKVVPLGVDGPKWKQQTVKQLNSALDDWVGSVPEHLKWSPHIKDPVFANQSATIFLTYYMVQLLIYRPFLPSAQLYEVQVEFPLPALAVCINAAKACLRILEVQLPAGMTDIPIAMTASQISAALLVQHVWRLKAQEKVQPTEAVQDVKPVPGQTIPELLSDAKKFIGFLEDASVRWPLAGLMMIHLKASLPAERNRGDCRQPNFNVTPEGPLAMAAADSTDHPDFLPFQLSTTSAFPAARVNLNLESHRSPSYTFVAPLNDYISTTRFFSTADSTPRINEELDQTYLYPQDQDLPFLHPTPYHELLLTDTTIPSCARIVASDPFTKCLAGGRGPTLKQEVSDEYEATHEGPSVHRSIFAPASSQEYLQTSDMDDRYTQRNLTWRQSNIRTAHAD